MGVLNVQRCKKLYKSNINLYDNFYNYFSSCNNSNIFKIKNNLYNYIIYGKSKSKSKSKS